MLTVREAAPRAASGLGLAKAGRIQKKPQVRQPGKTGHTAIPRLAEAGKKRPANDDGVGEAGGKRLETAAGVVAAVEGAENALVAEVVLAAPGPRKRGRPRKAATATGAALAAVAEAAPALRRSGRLTVKEPAAAVAVSAASVAVEASAAEDAAAVAVVGPRRGRGAARANFGGGGGSCVCSSRASVDHAAQVRTALASPNAAVLP